MRRSPRTRAQGPAGLVSGAAAGEAPGRFVVAGGAEATTLAAESRTGRRRAARGQPGYVARAHRALLREELARGRPVGHVDDLQLRDDGDVRNPSRSPSAEALRAARVEIDVRGRAVLARGTWRRSPRLRARDADPGGPRLGASRRARVARLAPRRGGRATRPPASRSPRPQRGPRRHPPRPGGPARPPCRWPTPRRPTRPPVRPPSSLAQGPEAGRPFARLGRGRRRQ